MLVPKEVVLVQKILKVILDKTLLFLTNLGLFKITVWLFKNGLGLFKQYFNVLGQLLKENIHNGLKSKGHYVHSHKT